MENTKNIAFDEACENCSGKYFYDQGRRCWKCDVLLCPTCIEQGPEPLCPECSGKSLPESIEPMLAKLSKVIPTGDNWRYEYKWDGIRALTYWEKGKLRIESRNLLNITSQYHDLSDIGEALGDYRMIVDGEILAFDERNRPSFARLQRRMHTSPAKAKTAARQVPAYYYLFDILHLDGEDLMGQPYIRRREILEALKIDHPRIKIPQSYDSDGDKMLVVAKKHGLEGIIAKRANSRYSPGSRSGDWQKIKVVKEQEFVIGGWTARKDSSDKVGSLLVGYYDNKGLVYAGSVGTGFDEATHKMLVRKLRPLETDKNPFEDKEFKIDIKFVKPKLIAQVRFNRWPPGGDIQQASFKGLRTDKSPVEVRKEGDY